MKTKLLGYLTSISVTCDEPKVEWTKTARTCQNTTRESSYGTTRHCNVTDMFSLLYFEIWYTGELTSSAVSQFLARYGPEKWDRHRQHRGHYGHLAMKMSLNFNTRVVWLFDALNHHKTWPHMVYGGASISCAPSIIDCGKVRVTVMPYHDPNHPKLLPKLMYLSRLYNHHLLHFGVARGRGLSIFFESPSLSQPNCWELSGFVVS